MQDRQHIYMAATDTVRDDEGASGHNQFTSSRDASRPSSIGELTKPGNGLPNTLTDCYCGCRPLLRYEFPDFVQIGNRLSRVADDHCQRAKAALTSSSLANSPASAWRSPCWM